MYQMFLGKRTSKVHCTCYPFGKSLQKQFLFRTTSRSSSRWKKFPDYPSIFQFQPHVQKKKLNHPRNITWFCPPYSESGKTPIGKTFLRFLRNRIPSNHRYAKHNLPCETISNILPPESHTHILISRELQLNTTYRMRLSGN